MSYNDGKVHTDFYDKQVDIKQIADDFSEGDHNLKSVLLLLWENGIMTDACCRGHDDGRPPYISFIINEKSKKLIQATSKYLYLQDGKIELDFSFYGKDYDTFIVYMGDEKSKEDFLNFVNRLLSKKAEHETFTSNIPKYGEYLLKFARMLGVHCRFSVERDNMMLGFTKPGTAQFFNENCPSLDDMLQSIKETGNLPLVPFQCSEKSLQEFINIFYPNTFTTQNIIQK